MTAVHQRFANTLSRIAAATSVVRTRGEDAARFEAHGGTGADLAAKIEEVLPELERIALRLERAASSAR